MRKLLSTLFFTFIAGSAAASGASPMPEAPTRVGLGQDTGKEPVQLRNLKLTDPLVQQKYLNEPDMLRFLRATYSEACTRGLVREAANSVKMDLKKEYPAEARQAAAMLLESNRIWKLSSFEMEGLFKEGYLNAANYCDCMMREVADQDLVNPKKGIEVIEKLSRNVQLSCRQNATELTRKQVAARQSLDKKAKDAGVPPESLLYLPK